MHHPKHTIHHSFPNQVVKYLLVGTVIWLLTKLLDDQCSYQEWILSVVITAGTWQAVDFTICELDKYFTWEKQGLIRLYIQSITVTLVSVLTIGILVGIYRWLMNKPLWENIGGIIIIGTTVSLFITILFTALHFFHISQHYRKELEDTQLRAQIESLKQQINPHFLFNSLNTLTALIEGNPNAATQFVQELSYVYRYVLESGKREFADIPSEIEFLHSYGYLLQQRFGKSLHFDIQIPDKTVGFIPSLSLQLLAENAVKHNIVSLQKPLTIEVKIEDNKLLIRNTLQLKRHAETSTGIGLSNIVSRYKLIGADEPLIFQQDHLFIVSLPILPHPPVS